MNDLMPGCVSGCSGAPIGTPTTAVGHSRGRHGWRRHGRLRHPKRRGPGQVKGGVRRDGGMTAGNAGGLNDGAGALLLAGEQV